MNTSQSEITELWGLDKQDVNVSYSRVNLKHGMYANAPIVCKSHACAYLEDCIIPPSNRVYGRRCPMEAGAIIARQEYWEKHFKIELKDDGTYKEEDAADVSLIQDLVKLEVKLMRIERKIAISGDFMSETIADVDKKCVEHKEKIVSPESEYEIKLFKEKENVLRLLNATRKDKVGQMKPTQANSESITIFNKVKKKKLEKQVDIDKVDFSTMPEVSDDEILQVVTKTTTVVNNNNNNEDINIEYNNDIKDYTSDAVFTKDFNSGFGNFGNFNNFNNGGDK